MNMKLNRPFTGRASASRCFWLLGVAIILLAGCVPNSTRQPSPTAQVSVETRPAGSEIPVATATPSTAPSPTTAAVPAFSHLFVIVLENKEYDAVIGNKQMPHLNQLAQENALLTEYYAVAHPSLPNYLALVSGSTFGVNTDCQDCYQSAETLADRLEAAGQTWKAYNEAIPTACFQGNQGRYQQKHNPFNYFDNIRTNAERCAAHIVSLDALTDDLKSGSLPDFALIAPDMCHTAHDCGLDKADDFVRDWVDRIRDSKAYDDHSLIVVLFDEGKSEAGCCGAEPGGGKVAALLISPLVKPGFQDATPYNHYALLKTLLAAWGLPPLGATASDAVPLITAPWK